MTEPTFYPLLVGELLVDVTITGAGQENKLRLGGIAHAARGFWAAGVPFAIATFVPSYLEQSARDYLTSFGCNSFNVLGHVNGAPNVILIFDAIEVADQGYEALLRDQKSVAPQPNPATIPDACTDALIFPGSYDLAAACAHIPKHTRLHIDAAYDVAHTDDLKKIGRTFHTVLLSTSSELFRSSWTSTFAGLAGAFSEVASEAFILKENRGGSRLYDFANATTEAVPAQLGKTANSVGVGDVYDAGYVTFRAAGIADAAWRAMSMSSAYSQTTEPDLFKKYAQRDINMPIDGLRALGGTKLAWEDRQNLPIYLAAPDFSDADTREIERAVSALQYHNFRVRRPVKENGELPKHSDKSALVETYQKDILLMRECRLVFAVPTGRDPGTLVEMGLAIAASIPVVVFDPKGECANTMVMAGSKAYSDDLDACLNAVFANLSEG